MDCAVTTKEIPSLEVESKLKLLISLWQEWKEFDKVFVFK
jgi:hypothetical protein